MPFNRADLRDVAREEITVDPSGGVWSDDKLNQYINVSHRKLQKDLQLGFPANELKDTDITADGSLEYAFTSTGVIEIVKIGNVPLDPTTKKDLLKFTNLEDGGTPSQYYLEGDVMGFNVKPGSGITIKVWHTQYVIDFTNDTGESSLPDTDEVKLAIAYYVKYLAWKKQKGQRATAMEAKEEYENTMNELRSEYWGRQNHSFNLDRVPDNSLHHSRCDSAYNNSL
jgi:hypothetical protein